jgi:type I restriction enzyme R subunit
MAQSYESFKPDKTALANATVESDYIVLTQLPSYARDPSWINEKTREDFKRQNNLRFLRPYQLKAIHALQRAVGDGKDRFLFEMATGTGKTLVSAAVIRLFLKTGNARHVLFLVDRIELENQADKNFRAYLKNDYIVKIYKQHKDDWKNADIVVSTIQTLLSGNRYKRIFAPDSFDLVISDEAHRSIGGLARAVFEYFIGSKLGLTATPKDYLKNSSHGVSGEPAQPDGAQRSDFVDPREIERRILLDTYKTFGCESGEPTFRYSLVDGIKDGFLINPIVLDARTDITTQLLSDKGYAVLIAKEEAHTEAALRLQRSSRHGEEEEEIVEEIFISTDFEKKFFSDSTNHAFCAAFMQNALRDPITGEIGKTICFCVSQNHARRITEILNKMADIMYPGKYMSDFAVQVTSRITGAQGFTINFTNNNLLGTANFNPGYRTSKARVCVTVGMMTTGYDCPDILNLCLMRPIFSPTDFIQIKGRGTRKHNFSEELIDQEAKKTWLKGGIQGIGTPTEPGTSEGSPLEKQNFKLFDFFANCEYFEDKYDYDEVLSLPKEADWDVHHEVHDQEARYGGNYWSSIEDALKSLNETAVGTDGMKIDRMFFDRFSETIKHDSKIEEFYNAGKWEELDDYIAKNIFDKPTDYFNLQKLRSNLHADRRISLREMLDFIFGKDTHIKTREELLEDEFNKFDSRVMPAEELFNDAKAVFKAYIEDDDYREAIETGNYAELNTLANGDAWRRLTPELRRTIPEYIKDNINLASFGD